MRIEDWLKQGSNRVAAGIGGAAAASGVMLGLYLQLPGYLAHPVAQFEPQYINADDPGLAKYKQVVSEIGGVGATFVVPRAFYTQASTNAAPADMIEDTERLVREIEAEVRATESRYARWEAPQPQEQVRWSRAEAAEPAGYEREDVDYRSEPERYVRIERYREPVQPEPYYRAQPVRVGRYEPEQPRWERRYVPPQETVTSYDEAEPQPPPVPAPSVRW